MAETQLHSTQVVLTLSPESEIIKVEILDKSGNRHELGIQDFASLAGDDDVEGLFPVLEQAYEAGFSDANSDVFESDDSKEGNEDDFERMVVRGVASRRLIRRGVRRLIFSRLIRRELLRKQGEMTGRSVKVDVAGAVAERSH
jgi:hypothetical protein